MVSKNEPTLINQFIGIFMNFPANFWFAFESLVYWTMLSNANQKFAEKAKKTNNWIIRVGSSTLFLWIVAKQIHYDGSNGY